MSELLAPPQPCTISTQGHSGLRKASCFRIGPSGRGRAASAAPFVSVVRDGPNPPVGERRRETGGRITAAAWRRPILEVRASSPGTTARGRPIVVSVRFIRQRFARARRRAARRAPGNAGRRPMASSGARAMCHQAPRGQPESRAVRSPRRLKWAERRGWRLSKTRSPFG